jgi:hypothetical protein
MKEYVCECGKTFTNPNAYSGHRCRCSSNPNNSKVFICEFCGVQITGLHSYNKHKNYCENNPDRKIRVSTNSMKNVSKASDNVLLCQFCGKACRGILSLRAHERLCKCNPNHSMNNVELGILKQSLWNKGLTKDTHPSIMAAANKLKGRPGVFTGKTHSVETKEKMSTTHTELWHKDDNRRTISKAGWYDGIYMMSTYELSFYIYNKDLGKIVHRCKDRFFYELDGKGHYYYPDFVLDGRIVEIKGYETDLDRLKYSLVPNILVLKHLDIKPYIEYVKSKYKVDNLEELYESHQ